MTEEKDLNEKKKEILDKLADIKTEYKSLAMINKSLKEEKKFMKSAFHEKEIEEKKNELLNLIHNEDERKFWNMMKPKGEKK